MKQGKHKYEFQSRRKYKTKQLVIIIVIILCCLSIVAILAQYIFNTLNDFFLRSKEFYFYSDKLKENELYYQVDNWSGVDDYTITVNMNSSDNNLKFTSYDINYSISYECSSNVVCQLSKTSGTISSNTHSDYFNLIITPNANLTTGTKVWAKITASSTSEYQKTLSANFTLVVGKENLSYEIVDSANNPYMELNITNTLTYYNVAEAFDTYSVGDKIDMDVYSALTAEKKNKCYSAWITLAFDPNVIHLDMTNSNYLNNTSISTTTINNQTYINGMSFKIDAVSSSKVRFYKVDPSQNYTYPITNTTPVVTVTSR